MTGPEHYEEAERLLKAAGETSAGDLDQRIAAATAHALLALTAATVSTRALGPQEMWGGHTWEAGPEWQQVTGA